jgi:hypothetical protein
MFRGIAAICLASCTLANQQVGDPAGSLNETVFKCSVEPILTKQCSFNACHGIAGAAFRVYSPGKLRATTPTDITGLIAPLTDPERHANFESASGFSFNITSVDDNFLLRKPLPAADGGYEHVGGAIYSGGTNNTAFMTIRAWLTGTGVCP